MNQITDKQSNAISAPAPSAFTPRQLRFITCLVLACWTLAVVASLVWNMRLLHLAILEAATTDARSNFNKDVIYRRWAASHGGVYVPVTAATPPNPYLTNVFERDLVTPSGRQLTLVNPAYMTRQVYELEAGGDGIHGHLTSLKPLRPENAPDAWEAAALRAFEQGRTEVVSRELRDGKPHLRLMRPFIAEAACLKCHASQGYRAGDIRGGISIAVPLDSYLALTKANFWPVAGVHAGLWALGALGVVLGSRQMRQRLDRQLQAEQETRRQAAFPRLNPNPVLELDANGEIKYANAAAGELARELGCPQPSQLLPPNGAAIVQECLASGKPRRRVEIGLGPRVISWSFFPVEAHQVVHCYGGDITDRKRAEDMLRQLSRAVEQSPASIVITDPKGAIEYVNPKFTNITGYSLAEVLGRNSRVLKSGDKSPEAYRELWQTILAGKEWHGEFHNRTKHGELYWESASISPIRDDSGRTTHFVAVKEDVTARKQTEAERNQLIVELRQALAEIKSLSGIIPICAGCKQIRDDKGYWSQVESYIEKHSGAKFSHGLCPTCMPKYFPDEAGGDSADPAKPGA